MSDYYQPLPKAALDKAAKIAAARSVEDERLRREERLDRFAVAALALTGEADMAHAKIASLEDRAEFAYGMALAMEAEREKISARLKTGNCIGCGGEGCLMRDGKQEEKSD